MQRGATGGGDKRGQEPNCTCVIRLSGPESGAAGTPWEKGNLLKSVSAEKSFMSLSPERPCVLGRLKKVRLTALQCLLSQRRGLL